MELASPQSRFEGIGRLGDLVIEESEMTNEARMYFRIKRYNLMALEVPFASAFRLRTAVNGVLKLRAELLISPQSGYNPPSKSSSEAGHR